MDIVHLHLTSCFAHADTMVSHHLEAQKVLVRQMSLSGPDNINLRLMGIYNI